MLVRHGCSGLLPCTPAPTRQPGHPSPLLQMPADALLHHAQEFACGEQLPSNVGLGLKLELFHVLKSQAVALLKVVCVLQPMYPCDTPLCNTAPLFFLSAAQISTSVTTVAGSPQDTGAVPWAGLQWLHQ